MQVTEAVAKMAGSIGSEWGKGGDVAKEAEVVAKLAGEGRSEEHSLTFG